MSPAEYQDLLLRTAPPQHYDATVKERLFGADKVNLLHSQLGICTESGEFADIVKRYLYYGQEIDRTHLIEELGDLTWYLGLAIAALGITWSEVFETNIRKLTARYPEKFQQQAAIHRDLGNERRVLEEIIKDKQIS
jgi:NTP pyrophosphatase (non-canonical NTP hydrolase)